MNKEWFLQKNVVTYHTCDYHSPNITKSSLGEFTNQILSRGGIIRNSWVFNPSYNRSVVYFVIDMHPEAAEEFNLNTKWKLVLPRQIVLN